MFYDRFILLCKEKGVKPAQVAASTGINKGSFSVWKKKAMEGIDVEPTSENLKKISVYFNVSTDYLLEKTDIKKHPATDDEEEIAKVALFGGAEEVTDEMWNEVLNYVEFIKQREKKNDEK